ncbi:hypothetical protein HDU97_002029 [Phlyctochytrium planicorne]|nr:hypothetical protein HDU97_002029 [Phlyctochytrium planicorne]
MIALPPRLPLLSPRLHRTLSYCNSLLPNPLVRHTGLDDEIEIISHFSVAAILSVLYPSSTYSKLSNTTTLRTPFPKNVKKSPSSSIYPHTRILYLYVKKLIALTRATAADVTLAAVFLTRLRDRHGGPDIFKGSEGFEFRLFTISLMLAHKLNTDTNFSPPKSSLESFSIPHAIASASSRPLLPVTQWSRASKIPADELRKMEMEFLFGIDFDVGAHGGIVESVLDGVVTVLDGNDDESYGYVMSSVRRGFVST